MNFCEAAENHAGLKPSKFIMQLFPISTSANVAADIEKRWLRSHQVCQHVKAQ